MIRTIAWASCAFIVSLGFPGSLPAAEKQGDLASQALAVFAAKCAGCHGPNLQKPRGRFGYVLDLARVASNREMIVPSSPEESELWDLVSRNEMPPSDSPTGPLSSDEKEVIRAWIAAGAPARASSQASAAPTPEPERQDDVSAASSSFHILKRLGSLHVMLVHFPIALILAAAMGEFWSMCRGIGTPRQWVRSCVLLGAAGGLAAASLGWLQASNGYGVAMPQILRLHRWMGTATALWSIVAALLSERDERRGTRSLWFRAWLLMGACLVAASAHLGGVLVHGEDYFSGG